MSDTRVLIVDDDPQFLDIVTRWLGESYTVREATIGEDALELMDDSIDVVLLDRRLPDMSGDDVLRRFRAAGYDCPVAMLTAVDPDFDILDMAFDDYLVKPALRREITDTVDSLIDRAAFGDKVRERFALSTKLATLESELPRQELRASDEYTDARERLEELDDELVRIVGRSAERDDVEGMYHDIERVGEDADGSEPEARR